MQTRDILGFFLLPLTMLVAAWVINTFRLWSYVANMTLPWLCTAVAVSLLTLGAVCLVLQVAPSAIRTGVAVLVVSVLLVILGIGMAIDACTYSEGGQWLANVAEWLGFAVIQAGTFVLARLGKA